MADSLLDLEAQPLFTLEPNWASSLNTSFAMSRLLTEYPGSAQNLESLTDDAPYMFDAGFLLTTKAEEYTLLAFFNARRGMNQRFWMRHPQTAFTLKTAALAGSTSLVCSSNASWQIYRGWERLYIRMSNGDTLTRQIAALTHDTVADTAVLTLTSPLDRDLTLTNHDLIGRLLLVRLADDTLSHKIASDTVSKVDLSFIELVQEYAEL
jgi:hypothetical protein